MSAERTKSEGGVFYCLFVFAALIVHFLRLLLAEALTVHLSHVVVIGHQVGVLEENNSVGEVALDAVRAEGVAAFVTGEDYLMHPVSLHFAKRLHLLGLISLLGFLLLRELLL